VPRFIDTIPWLIVLHIDKTSILFFFSNASPSLSPKTSPLLPCRVMSIVEGYYIYHVIRYFIPDHEHRLSWLVPKNVESLLQRGKRCLQLASQRAGTAHRICR